MTNFTSDYLMHKIKDLCAEFQRNVGRSLGGQYLCINEGNVGTIGEFSGEIYQEYHRIFDILKKGSIHTVEVYDESIDSSITDYHLSVAVFIRSFLTYPPFCIDVPMILEKIKHNKYINFPNEYFIIYFLTAIFQLRNNDFDKTLRLDNDFQIKFVNLLSQYRENIESLSPIPFANEIGLIEHNYFI